MRYPLLQMTLIVMLASLSGCGRRTSLHEARCRFAVSHADIVTNGVGGVVQCGRSPDGPGVGLPEEWEVREDVEWLFLHERRMIADRLAVLFGDDCPDWSEASNVWRTVQMKGDGYPATIIDLSIRARDDELALRSLSAFLDAYRQLIEDDWRKLGEWRTRWLRSRIAEREEKGEDVGKLKERLQTSMERIHSKRKRLQILIEPYSVH